jgi:pyridoxal phosphate enzyme (YggS family)
MASSRLQAPVVSDASAVSPSPAKPLRQSSAAPADLARTLGEVRERIDAAARGAGRRPDTVQLVAVSKNIELEAILRAFRAGQTVFGEARPQQLVEKDDRLRAHGGAPEAGAAGAGLQWHFVGQLQRNKVKDVVGRVSLIHSVDRSSLAREVAARARRHGLAQPVLLQVNAGGDPAKGGCKPDEAAGLVAEMAELEGVTCHGLMTVPPMGQDPRPTFAALRSLRDELVGSHPDVGALSMGMSGDFETAVGEGATIVRVGEAVFGERPERGEPSPPPDPSGRGTDSGTASRHRQRKAE